MIAERFEGIEQDLSEVDDLEELLRGEEPGPSSRWTHPEVEGVEIPIYEGITDSRTMSDYVTSDGPAARALRAAGGHHPIALVPLSTVGFPAKGIEHWRAVVDLGSGRMVGKPVTSRYHQVQNATMAAMLDAILPEDANVKVHLSEDKSRLVFLIALGASFVSDELKQQIEKERDHFNRGVHGWKHRQAYVPPTRHELALVNTHGGWGKLSARVRVEFLACDNGLMTEQTETGFSWSHTCYLAERIEQARAAFEASRGSYNNQAAIFRRLFETPINATQWDQFVVEMFPGLSEISGEVARRRRLELLNRFDTIYQYAPGAVPGSAYGALAAATFYTTHELGVREKDPARAQAKRFELQIEGQGAKINEKAYVWALDCAGLG